ncbi:sulfurtransferase [Arthrobacter sp. MYb23]|uniref:sulfurtransferase n=1 Tax=unclassified Arthrobacter TaxID=235627 RepID=UPI000CFDFBCC|nr:MULTISPECIES: sulfurtransferase [unclassified Arthrobacter]PRB41429.1 sulfurtransferase [Arthrobacter sp. MYb51]PRB95713.1 sulfurtransferase [Arthrobacter sp. MYb23]
MGEELKPFVDWNWCARNLGRVVFVDTRWYLDGASGKDAYDAGHLLDAVFMDMDRWLSGPASPEAGRNPLPDPEVFAQGMREAGISDSDTVVAYDDAGGVIAARLVWMLRSTGHTAAILDGGIGNYPGDLSTETPLPRTGSFTAKAWPADLLADISEASSDAFLTVDARNRDRFEGRQDPIDPRPGHIPGAVNVPCRENLDATGHLLAEPQIRANFERAGVLTAKNTTAYCGSGVTACHNLLVMEQLGMGTGKLFVGGWSQYGHALDRPVETTI